MIAAVIQARMNSTRLPGKILIQVCGKPFLQHLIERIKNSKKINKIIVATSLNKEDDVIEEFCNKYSISCYRGSENDVLSRYKDASDKFKIDTIVRLTSDTPLLDGKMVDETVQVFLENNADFVSNCYPLPRTYPDGTNVEVFSKKILNEMYEKAKKPSEREHVTFYVLDRPKEYTIIKVDLEKDFSKYRFNLDYKEDYELLKILFEKFYENNQGFTIFDCIEFLKQNPDIQQINSKIIPFQGILKSFDIDAKMGFSKDKEFFNP